MAKLINKLTELNRREVVKGMAGGLLGLNFAPFIANAANKTASVKGGGKAKSVIFIKINGGISHVDSFDIKEDNKDAMKASAAIKTNADGVRISKHFPQLAKHMDKCAIINSMFNTQGAHPEASYLTYTSYERRGTIVHPRLGAWVSKMSKAGSQTIPKYIATEVSSSPGSGFLGSKYSALPVVSPESGLANIKRASGVSEKSFQRQLKLMSKLNNEFTSKVKNEHITSYSQIYEDAVKLMSSKDLEAFDISKESKATHAAYGKDRFGKSLILARRLVEKGVPFVTACHDGWDDHYGIYEEFNERAVSLDQGISALLADLASRGLLETTLVVITTEFGRSPELNAKAGRNHHPVAYSSILAGGGIKGGQKYGKTDSIGKKIIENKVKVPDFNATILYSMGLPFDYQETTPSGRPIQVTDKGKPITSLF